MSLCRWASRREDFNFEIVNHPFLDGDVPDYMVYTVGFAIISLRTRELVALLLLYFATVVYLLLSLP